MRLRSGVQRPLAAVVLALTVGAGLSACTGDDPAPAPSPSAKPEKRPVELTFGVFGSSEEVAGYDSMVRQFNGLNEDEAQVEVKVWESREEELGAFEKDGLPDVFLLSRADLAAYDGQIHHVDELLDSRGVEFGDAYSRDSLEAFSVDNKLVCMPYGISPMVIYINTDLVDFAKMQERDLGGPAVDSLGSSPRSWSFEEFTASAQFATKPRQGTRGLFIEPTLRGLAPFVVSGGGQIFDDDKAPTSLAMSADATREALDTTLELIRDSSLTLTQKQLDEASPLEWFKRGKLGMIAGFRDLVPQLRREQTLNFDVMAIPEIEDRGTIGDITGLCLNNDGADLEKAADFLTYAVSEESVKAVSRAGYLVPANLIVSASSAFLEPGRQPANSRVFYFGMRDIYIPPLLETWEELDEAVGPELVELVNTPILEPENIDEITARIDETSREILAPETVEPTDEPTDDPSDEQTGSAGSRKR